MVILFTASRTILVNAVFKEELIFNSKLHPALNQSYWNY